MSLIKKASYLTDNGRVTFGHHSKRFTAVRLEERERRSVFLWARHACLMRKWTGREIIVGVAHNQVPSWVAQAAFLLCWGVISTPSTLILIYEDNQSAGKRP